METAGDRLLRYAPATLRNREPILAVLQRVLPEAGLLLEIASGSGEHAAFITPRLSSGWEWQPSELNPGALADIDAQAIPVVRASAPRSSWMCANPIGRLRPQTRYCAAT